ncbi:MAG TPA: hypothetical protein VIJ30_09365 [Candidatus Dormibacteraeota bacterium]|jgi:hypothetical protein
MPDFNKAHLEIWLVYADGSKRALERDDGHGGKAIEYPAGEAGTHADGQAFAHHPWETGLRRVELRTFDEKGQLVRTDAREFDEKGQQIT